MLSWSSSSDSEEETWEDWCEEEGDAAPMHLLFCDPASTKSEHVVKSVEEVWAHCAARGFDVHAFRSTHRTSRAYLSQVISSQSWNGLTWGVPLL